MYHELEKKLKQTSQWIFYIIKENYAKEENSFLHAWLEKWTWLPYDKNCSNMYFASFIEMPSIMEHTVPLAISYQLFRFLIGEYSVVEIRLFIKKRN